MLTNFTRTYISLDAFSRVIGCFKNLVEKKIEVIDEKSYLESLSVKVSNSNFLTKYYDINSKISVNFRMFQEFPCIWIRVAQKIHLQH